MTRTHGMIRPRAPWVFPREPEAVRKVFEDLGEKRTYADGAFPERDEAFLVTHGFVLLFFPVYEDAGENPAVGVVPPGAALDATEASERPLAVAYAACFGPVEGAALRESVLLWEAAASPALLPLFRANAIRKENAMLEGLAARRLALKTAFMVSFSPRFSLPAPFFRTTGTRFPLGFRKHSPLA